MSVLVNSRVVREFLLLGVDAFADVDGIYHPVEVAQEVIEKQESRPTLNIHLKRPDVQTTIVEEFVCQLVELDRQLKSIEDPRYRVNSKQVKVFLGV